MALPAWPGARRTEGLAVQRVMSLRLRLTLGLLAVVAPLALVGLVTFAIHGGIQGRVAELGRTSTVELDLRSVVGQPLELEGRWDAAGLFHATEIERLPFSRRPKLRGPIQDLDLAGRSLRLYGLWILVTGETEFPGGESAADPLAALTPGARVEVSCKVGEDGSWRARKVESVDVKSSDKVKGIVTAAPAGADRLLEVHGLRIRVDEDARLTYARGPLYQLEHATRMAFAVQESLAAAQGLLKERYRERELPTRAAQDAEASRRRARLEDAVEEAEDRVLDGLVAFSRSLSESTSSAGAMGVEAWIGPLEGARATFERDVRRFLVEARRDPDAAGAYLDRTLEPELRRDVLPTLRAFGLELEERLGGELRNISTESVAAAHLALTATVGALVLALVTGLFLARSITRPILALARAAQRVGHGELETRVEVTRRDEVGALAEAFNRMAADLAERRRSEGLLRRSLSDKALLLREVHHRVKNNLQVLSSLLDLQARDVGDPAALTRLQESQDRIRSMVFIHDQLYRTDDLETIDLRAYLELLVAHLALAHADPTGRVTAQVRVDDLSLDLDRALACGLIVNELVTNAYKHAFPGERRGEIVVSCSAEGDGRLALSIRDDGRGFDGGAGLANASTLGLSLVTTLVEQLGGRLRVEGRGGAVFHIEFAADIQRAEVQGVA